MSQTKQKRWTKEFIFETLEDNGFHPTDVKFLDGYFIFDHGKDLVIHFHIKELKGWLFGVWWNTKGEKKFDLFAQYERDINKFKPSASALVREDILLEHWEKQYFVQMCRFIKKHPYRAWELDQSWHHEIWEWDDLKGCFKHYWQRWWQDSVCGPRIYKIMQKRYLKLLESITFICLVNPEIHDENTDDMECSPRYSVFCDGIRGEKVEEKGWYGLDFVEELEPWLLKKIDRYNRKWEKLRHKYFQLHDIELGDWIDVCVRKKK